MHYAGATVDWQTLEEDTLLRKAAADNCDPDGKIVAAEQTTALLEAVLRPGDKVCLEGDNQKQADYLAQCLAQVNPLKIHDLHMVQSVLALPAHLDVFEKGIAKKLDMSYAGPLAGRLAELLQKGKLQLGAIHTYLELYGRYFIDLTPKVALLAAEQADKDGNLYTGFSTEDTPTIAEATKFRGGIVIVQVNKIVDELPRIDIPGDWVDYIVPAPKPFYIEPLFTRDPARITDSQVLKAMLALKGIYAEYGVQSLNHGIGYDTAAIELLLPTYGEELGLKGKICSHFVLNPHPTLIPAIESGWVKSIYSFGGELGMEKYVQARSDVFFIGPDGSMRSNRALAQIAGHYAIDMFVGSTLQIDPYGNSSTATKARITGFGGAPNMGCDARGRRHSTSAWLKTGQECVSNRQSCGPIHRGKRLVVQMAKTMHRNNIPGFVEELDAFSLARTAHLATEPVMIYGDDVTHIVTEKGIAYLHKCRDMQERTAAIRAIAGTSEVGLKADAGATLKLRQLGIVKLPEDLGIDKTRANRSLLAAQSIGDLVDWSHGLYEPPAKFLAKK